MNECGCRRRVFGLLLGTAGLVLMPRPKGSPSAYCLLFLILEVKVGPRALLCPAFLTGSASFL